MTEFLSLALGALPPKWIPSIPSDKPLTGTVSRRQRWKCVQRETERLRGRAGRGQGLVPQDLGRQRCQDRNSGLVLRAREETSLLLRKEGPGLEILAGA